MLHHFYHAQVLRNHRIESGEVWVADGKIVEPQSKADRKIDVLGGIIAPGFIDLQVNGAFGDDIISKPEKVAEIAKRLGQYGVTSFLATVISSSEEQYKHILPILQSYVGDKNGAELLGIHLEGPCFNPAQAKAHRKDLIRQCADFASPIDCYGSIKNVKLVTLAPEVSGAHEWIDWLTTRGIVVAAGHSNATAVEMEKAIAVGVTMATHLFNAMGSFHHRSPGLLGAIFNHPGFYYSIIADGVHVSSLAIALAWRCQPQGLILVSDAISSLGMKSGNSHLGDRQILVENKKAILEGTDIIAGGVVGMDQLVRNLVTFTGATPVEALEAASLRPARILGIQNTKGTLDIGADADLVILDQALNVTSCYAKGVLQIESRDEGFRS